MKKQVIGMSRGKVFHTEVMTRAKALGKSLTCLQSNMELCTASEDESDGNEPPGRPGARSIGNE